jgi:hypothetical protein
MIALAQRGSRKIGPTPINHALNGQMPLPPEVSLAPCSGVLRDERDKQSALLNLAADRGIPGITAAQLALIEARSNRTRLRCRRRVGPRKCA